jgi:hypothetical protein
LCTRSRAPLQIPRSVWVGVLVAAATTLQWLPIPGLRELLASPIADEVGQALATTDVSARPGLSVSSADTGLEAARLFGLVALFIAGAQLSWRTTATVVAATGSIVALVGYAHAALGMDAIYGRYLAQDIDLAGVPALLTSFVNPNHQSSLLLLGMFCAGGLALDQHELGLVSRDPAKVDRYGDRFLAAMTALAVQLPALVLSLSRGALVTALILGPIALRMALRNDGSLRARRKRQRYMSPLRYAALAGMALLLFIVAQHGAWRELGTLTDLTDPGSATRSKFAAIADAPALIGMAPWLGTGRGTFIDLYGLVESTPSYVLQTHLESAPVAALVEWGPAVGSLLLVGVGLWGWGAWRRDPERRDSRSRRIVLLGVAAVAMHNLADFSLEFLGVSAPLIAVAGGLSSNERTLWHVDRAKWRMGLLLVAALGLAWFVHGDTFGRRWAQDDAIRRGKAEAAPALRLRPLDGRLHGQIARRAAEGEEWTKVRHHAQTATHLRPGAIDPWLLLAASERMLGHPQAAAEATAEGLGLLHVAPDEALTVWLLHAYPEPADLAAVTPRDSTAFAHLMNALVTAAPRHADAVAAQYTALAPSDPTPMRYRFDIAYAAGNAPLALHHARMWRAIAPDAALAYRAMALAFGMHDPPRLREAAVALENGLAREELDDPAVLEEALLGVLLRRKDPASLQRAREIGESLVKRPADRDTQRRREELAESIPSASP